MQYGSIFVILLAVSTSLGQMTSHCTTQQDRSCAAEQASRERSIIVDKVENSKDSMVTTLARIENSLAAIVSRLERLENTEADHKTMLHDIIGCGSFERMVRLNNKRQYMLGISRLTWVQARERCHQCGYSLARIESYEEQQYVKKWLTEVVTVTLVAPTNIHTTIWIDGTDLGHEGCWVWTHPNVTSFSSGFTAWRTNEPNNDGNNEHCNSLHSIGDNLWSWNDWPCDLSEAFLCKRTTNENVVTMPSLDDVRDAIDCLN